MMNQWDFYHASAEERDKEYGKAISEIERLQKEVERLKEKAREVVLQWQKVNNLGISIAGNDITHEFRTLISELDYLADGKKE